MSWSADEIQKNRSLPNMCKAEECVSDMLAGSRIWTSNTSKSGYFFFSIALHLTDTTDVLVKISILTFGIYHFYYNFLSHYKVNVHWYLHFDYYNTKNYMGVFFIYAH